MEDGLSLSGDFAERAIARDVYGAVRVEDAEDDAGGSSVEHGAGVVLHGGEFGFGVAEASAARADHGNDGNFKATLGFDDGADGRCKTAKEETRAEFDALGATTFGFDGVVERTATDF
jgi:hypothetical protein